VSVLTGELLAWVAREVGGPSSRAVRTRRLTGGVASDVIAVTVDTPTGRRRRVVVRRTKPDPPHTPAELVRQEAAILTGLAASGLPIPRLLAADPDGVVAGAAVLVMSMLPGRIELRPDDWPSYHRQLADVAARIHALEPPPGAPEYTLWVDPPETLQPPWWAPDPGPWRAALEMYAAGPPFGSRGFVHHDLQHFNVLWSTGRIAGVTDWGWASRNGPPDQDVGHCRLNLAGLHGAEVAEDFRVVYESAAGRSLEPWWDVVSILAVLPDDQPGAASSVQRQIGRRMRISEEQMNANVDAHLRSALRRV
jgi:aminoglycoside phosphotransferase (APT) family kinase protein